MTAGGGTFVVRLRRDIKFARTGDLELPDDRDQEILVAETIRLVGEDTEQQYPHPLRRVVVYRPYDSSRRKDGGDTAPPEHTIELVTNNGTWDAETISSLYKARGQIESFFKLIKQHLRIKSFIGVSPNAVLTQVWTAMCAILLLKYLIARSKYKWTLSNLVHFLRVNLFTKIDLWYWIDHPFQRKKPPDGELVQGGLF